MGKSSPVPDDRNGIDIKAICGDPGRGSADPGGNDPVRAPGSPVFKKIAEHRVCGGGNGRTCSGAGEGQIPPVTRQRSNPPADIADINFVYIHCVSGRGTCRHGPHRLTAP